MLEDPRLWVALAFFIFIGLTYKKISAYAIRALDERSAKIKTELDEARRLREEAQAVLADYRQKQAEYRKEAESILEEARRDGDILRARAEEDIKAAMDNRMKQAIERIAQEEASAIAEVRNHVVDMALSSARTLIADHVAAMPQDNFVQMTLGDIERKIH